MNPISQIANAQIIMIAMLVTELDKRGSISKSNFADLLRDCADATETEISPHLRDPERVDLILIRKLAELLGTERPKWTPAVIEGGKEGGPDK